MSSKSLKKSIKRMVDEQDVKRDHGRTSKAPPSEKGRKHMFEPKATTSHLDSALSRVMRFRFEFVNGPSLSSLCRNAITPWCRSLPSVSAFALRLIPQRQQ